MAKMDELFHKMVELKSSDLHFSTGSNPMLRTDGDLTPIEGWDVITKEMAREWLWEFMPERNQVQFEKTHDTDYAYALEGAGRFRCNVFMDRKGIGAVFRLIPEKILSADDLGLAEELRQLCFLPKGLVLVTGPTGSGKSTTLAALVDHINRNRADHIITIEDPVEFVHPNKKCLVNQREVHADTESFSAALRAALREDPDIVLVGEMRDLETTKIAIETAETGHLVFGTLHTSTAPSTVDRLINQFPANEQDQIRQMLGTSLKAVIAQTLCKKVGGGRLAALEVLIATGAVSAMIREAKTYQLHSVIQTGSKYGMVLLNDALMKLVLAKKVDPREAYLKSVDKDDLANRLRANSINVDVKVDPAAGRPSTARRPAPAARPQVRPPGMAPSPPGVRPPVRPGPPRMPGMPPPMPRR